MRPLLALAVLIAALTLTGRDAHARWCAFYDEYTYTCGFTSFEQCLATISGVGGTCRRDPFIQPGPSEGRRDQERRGRSNRDRDYR